MGLSSQRLIPLKVLDLGAVAQDVITHFEAKEYDAAGHEIQDGAWAISVTKGGLFKAVVGQKPAMKISLVPKHDGVFAKASVGLFGVESIPAFIAYLFFWPLIIAQVWGVLRKMKLDDEALEVVEKSVRERGTPV